MIARFWDIVAHYRVSTFSGVPTIYSALLNVPLGRADISSLEFAVCGAAPMPAKLIEDFEAKTRVKIVEGYGLTEGGCVSARQPALGRALRGLDRSSDSRSGDDLGDPRRDGTFRPPGSAPTRAPSSSGGRTSLEAISIRGTTRVYGSRSTARNGSTPAISAARMRTAISGSPAGSKELIIRGGHNIDPKVIEDALQKASGGGGGRGDRKSGCLRRRVASRLCSAEAWRHRNRGGTHRARRPDHSGEGGGPEARQDFVVSADDSGREAVQAGAH